MRLGHRMVNGNKMLILHALNADSMVFVGFFCFQGGEGNAAATDDRIPGAVDDIAADGTDVEFASQQVGGNVFIDNVFAVHQFNDGNTQGLGQRL